MEKRVKLSFFADEASPCLDGQLRLAASLGLDWMELRIVDGRNISTFTEEQTRALARRMQDEGIGVSAIASPVGKVSLSEPFGNQLTLLEHICVQATLLGTRNIRIFSFFDTEEADAPEVLDRIGRMVEVARRYPVCLLHENDSALFGHSAARCALLAEHFYPDHFALVYDPGNFVWGEGISDNVASCWPLLAGYVRHIHIKDWVLGHSDKGVLPGDGDAQIEALIEALSQSAYEGFVTLEPHTAGGGPFGGTTTPEQFQRALSRVRHYMDRYKVKY